MKNQTKTIIASLSTINKRSGLLFLAANLCLAFAALGAEPSGDFRNQPALGSKQKMPGPPSKAGRSGSVIMAVLKADRGTYEGPCPATIHFGGVIATDGPASVRYTFVRSDGATSPPRTMEFLHAGRQSVQSTWRIGETHAPRYAGWQAIKILSPNSLESSHATGAFELVCDQPGNRAQSVDLKNKSQRPVSEVATATGAVGNRHLNDPPAPSPPAPGYRRVDQLRDVADKTALFRVWLTGFKVNRQSDDDITEGDGRGDEIFIRCDSFQIPVGASNQVQTPVMGDPNGHPERIPAGSAPARWNQPGDEGGGLITGDQFPHGNLMRVPPDASIVTPSPSVSSPMVPPAVPAGDQGGAVQAAAPAARPAEPHALPAANRLPMVVWSGRLTWSSVDPSRNNMVVIVPSAWEWDSPSLSSSQRTWPEGLQAMVDDVTPALLPFLSATSPGSLSPVQSNFVLETDKAGTRPIGWGDNNSGDLLSPSLSHPVRGSIGTRLTHGDFVWMNFLALDLQNAFDAVHAEIPRGSRVFELRFQDKHDHGDYSLFLVLEQLAEP